MSNKLLLPRALVLLLLLFLVALSHCENPTNLCHVPTCRCDPNRNQPEALDVRCQCQSQQSIVIGNPEENLDASMPPNNSISLTIQGCHRIEFRSKFLNDLKLLKDLSVNHTEKLILGSMIYDSRYGTGQSIHMRNIQLENIGTLEVSRQTFAGISIDGEFLLNNVFMETVTSLAFKFDHVNEFNIMASRFDRVSMWGFKIESCDSFNVLVGARFFSLANQAFLLRCNKVMLAKNEFASIHDSAFDIRFVVADIQGNTFETLTGKPFINLRPISQEELRSIDRMWNSTNGASAGGFTFRENKFSANPTLPFGSLAIPAFGQIDPEVTYVNIDQNHFLCECEKLAWFIGAVTKHNFEREKIAAIGNNKQGYGAMDFIQNLYDTSGHCLKCSVTKCEVDKTQSFIEFANSALEVENGDLKCRKSGQTLLRQPNPGPTGPISYEYERGGSVDRLRRPTASTQTPYLPTIRPPKMDEKVATREVTNMDFNNGSVTTINYSLLLFFTAVMCIVKVY